MEMTMAITVITFDSEKDPVYIKELSDYKEIGACLSTGQGSPRVYTTRVVGKVGENWEYLFHTCSKELHLAFGRMDSEMHWKLASFFHEALSLAGVDQVVFSRGGQTAYVTQLHGDEGKVIGLHFSISSDR